MPDLAVKPIVWAAVAIGATVAVVVAAVFGLLRLEHTAPAGERFRFSDEAPLRAPGLGSDPQVELARIRREKQDRLQSAGWVDRGAGIAHIPIADAMDLLAARGAQGKRP